MFRGVRRPSHKSAEQSWLVRSIRHHRKAFVEPLTVLQDQPEGGPKHKDAPTFGTKRVNLLSQRRVVLREALAQAVLIGDGLQGFIIVGTGLGVQ